LSFFLKEYGFRRLHEFKNPSEEYFLKKNINKILCKNIYKKRVGNIAV